SRQPGLHHAQGLQGLIAFFSQCCFPEVTGRAGDGAVFFVVYSEGNGTVSAMWKAIREALR
ncbi:hypothetical protein, partial [Azospirillum argentinense]|uniref:hypothetical protein n=1 Tax=Azospirillum argentinense TaxID=2970906 RepID=UPI0032DEFF81